MSILKQHSPLPMITAAILSTSSLGAFDDVQLWSNFSKKLKNDWIGSWTLYNEWRTTDDLQNIRHFLLAPRVKRELDQRWTGELHLSYIFSKSGHTSPFRHQIRLEAEINPHWNLPMGWRLDLRNRFEWRWVESAGFDNNRIRQRWKVTKGRYSCSNEMIYDMKRGRYSENRFNPLTYTIYLTAQRKLELFTLLQSKRGAPWKHNFALGSHLKF